MKNSDNKEIWEALNEMKSQGLINDYMHEGDNIQIEFNQLAVISLLIRMPSVAIPVSLWDHSSLLNEDQKIFMLVFFDKLTREKKSTPDGNETSFTITETDFDNAYYMFHNYDLKSPAKYGDVYLFHPTFPDALDDVLLDSLQFILPLIRFPYPDLVKGLDPIINDIYEYEASDKTIDINAIAKKHKTGRNEIAAKILEFTKSGLIRFGPDLTIDCP